MIVNQGPKGANTTSNEGARLKRALLSLLVLAAFIVGIGSSAWFPSLRLLWDTQWDPSLGVALWSLRINAFLWLIPVMIGFCGWMAALETLLLNKLRTEFKTALGLGITLSFFSFFSFGLAINGILTGPTTAFFLLPFLFKGWRYLTQRKSFEKWGREWLWLVLPALFWGMEYLSSPIVWDAVLDHFRFAREVARLHQLPFHWVNHTGDMPKLAEMIWAGFWAMGGEALSKISMALALLLTLLIFFGIAKEERIKSWVLALILLTCPYLMALYAWGYVEGFLAVYGLLALICLVKSHSEKEGKAWVSLAFFFLGVALAVKFTAVLAVLAIGAVMLARPSRSMKNLEFKALLIFLIPFLPWLLRDFLANGNPFYPILINLFGGPPGFDTTMGNSLLSDTGLPSSYKPFDLLLRLGRVFFTGSNGVGAAWTPLVLMSLPWWGKVLKTERAKLLFLFCFVFLAGWLFLSVDFRHASGAGLGLVLLAGMAWGKAWEEKSQWPKWSFGIGCFLSLWLCCSAQLSATAPYASALGLEDPLVRLKRNYSLDMDTYAAYRAIEKDSGPRDKVVAFGVFQTYPLDRTAFVDFFWKKPIFLAWASQCRTAEDLALRLKREGVTHFLYQQGEAVNMSLREKGFELEGMPVKEYIRFWTDFAQPLVGYENSMVYRICERPLAHSRLLDQLPGIQEKPLANVKRSADHQQWDQALEQVSGLTDRFPTLASAWKLKAEVEERLGNRREAGSTGKKALGLGLENGDLYDTMMRCSNDAKDWQGKRDAFLSDRAQAIREALSHYRGE